MAMPLTYHRFTVDEYHCMGERGKTLSPLAFDGVILRVGDILG